MNRKCFKCQWWYHSPWKLISDGSCYCGTRIQCNYDPELENHFRPKDKFAKLRKNAIKIMKLFEIKREKEEIWEEKK